jgi:phosphatidylglycerol:prolipoprotein diacylglycerol transferase
VGRFGCALQHDHLGVASTHFLAVNFPSGPRFDLGLLEFLYLIPLALVFWALGRQPRPPGFYLGLYFALYGPGRFAMDALRNEDARYLGWTPAQYLCVAATLAGAALVAWSLRRARSAAA